MSLAIDNPNGRATAVPAGNNAADYSRPVGLLSSVSTSNTLFVVPIYSQLDVTASATVSLVQQETVEMKYDVSFNISISDEKSGKILNGFVLSQDGSSLTVDMRGNGYDADFQAELVDVIENAKETHSQKVLSWYLYDDALSYFKNVYGDDVANVLETDWSLNVAVDSSGGALNMWNDLDKKDAARLLIAEQIPNSTYMLYVDGSENMVTDAMPMKNGDTIVFLFNVTMQTIAREINNVQAQGSMAGALNPSYPTDASGGFQGDSNKVDPLAGGPGASSIGVDRRDVSDGSAVDVSGNYPTDSWLAPNYSYSQQVAAFYVTLTGDLSGGLVGSLVAVTPEASASTTRTHADGSGKDTIAGLGIYKLSSADETSGKDLDGTPNAH